MAMLDLALLVLSGTALVFSIIELGLSAYGVSIVSRAQGYYNYAVDGYGAYAYSSAFGSASAAVDFLLFCSLWTLLITAGLVALPIIWRRKTNTYASKNWHAPVLLGLTTVTMIFWLAGFADLASLYGGATATGVAGALLAFAVLLWLIFLALMVLNVLTALGIMTSERPGYTHVFNRRGHAPSHAPATHMTQGDRMAV